MYTVLINTTFSAGKSKSFNNDLDLLTYIVSECHAHTKEVNKEKLVKTLRDEIVSEDGKTAVSRVVAGDLAYAKALTMSFAQHLTIVSRPYNDDVDD